MDTIDKQIIGNTLDKFMKVLTTNLAQYFPSTEVAEQISDTSYRVHIDLPVTMEALSTMLDKTLKLYTLYAVGRKGEKEQTCVMYSRPFENNMYIIYMFSDDYGNITSFNVVFYTSMDQQFLKLTQELMKTRTLIGFYYSKQTPLQLALNFQ